MIRRMMTLVISVETPRLPITDRQPEGKERRCQKQKFVFGVDRQRQEEVRLLLSTRIVTASSIHDC